MGMRKPDAPHDSVRRVSPSAGRLVALTFLLSACVVAPRVHSAEETRRPRDAAEAVKEGDVSQWLKYYQRERTEAPTPAKPAQAAPAAPAQEESTSPSRDPADR